VKGERTEWAKRSRRAKKTMEIGNLAARKKNRKKKVSEEIR